MNKARAIPQGMALFAIRSGQLFRRMAWLPAYPTAVWQLFHRMAWLPPYNCRLAVIWSIVSISSPLYLELEFTPLAANQFNPAFSRTGIHTSQTDSVCVASVQ